MMLSPIRKLAFSAWFPDREGLFSLTLSYSAKLFFIVFYTCKSALFPSVSGTRGSGTGSREARVSALVLFNVHDSPHEKNIAKKFRKCLEVTRKASTFAPAFERERRFINDDNVKVSLGRGWGWLGQAIISNRPEIDEKINREIFTEKFGG